MSNDFTIKNDESKLKQWKAKRKFEKGPLAKVTFYRLNWSYLLAAILLMILPFYNYPMTSRFGFPYKQHLFFLDPDFEMYKFFLDPEFLATLDVDRNLMEYIVPLPIYYFMGVLPGALSLILFGYVLISAMPNKIEFGEHSLIVKEAKVLPYAKAQIPYDEIQFVDVGRRRMGQKIWFAFMFVSFWAYHIYMYGFETIQATEGIPWIFSVNQDIWDMEEVVGSINLGEHLLVTSIIFAVAPLMLVMFSRRMLHIESKTHMVKFAFAFARMKKVPGAESNLFKNPTRQIHLKSFKNGY